LARALVCSGGTFPWTAIDQPRAEFFARPVDYVDGDWSASASLSRWWGISARAYGQGGRMNQQNGTHAPMYGSHSNDKPQLNSTHTHDLPQQLVALRQGEQPGPAEVSSPFNIPSPAATRSTRPPPERLEPSPFLTLQLLKRSRIDTVPGSVPSPSALEATQGQMNDFFSQLPYKCHQNRVASVGD